MKTILLLPLSCLLLFASIGHAQQIVVGLSAPRTFSATSEVHITEMHFEDFETQWHPNESEFAEMERIIMEDVMKQSFRMMWNDSGTGFTSVTLLGVPEIREALGVSEEQLEQIGDAIGTKMEEMSEKMESEMKRIMLPVFQLLDPDLTLDTFDSFFDSFDPDSFDPETLHQLTMEFEGQMMEQMMSIQMNMMNEVMTNVMGDLLLPEQIQSMQEMQLAAMGEMPFISPGAFEALGLTDDQREELEQIKKELEPEFEENLDFFVKNFLKLHETLDSERNSGESQEEAMKCLMAENPEVRRMVNETQTRSREFSERVRTRMFDVLTDEQWMRLQELLDNPPEHARLFIRVIRESMGFGEYEESETASESEDTETRGMWMPGPDSWRPGMPVPESYRQQRNERRFPSRQ